MSYPCADRPISSIGAMGFHGVRLINTDVNSWAPTIYPEWGRNSSLVPSASPSSSSSSSSSSSESGSDWPSLDDRRPITPVGDSFLTKPNHLFPAREEKKGTIFLKWGF